MRIRRFRVVGLALCALALVAGILLAATSLASAGGKAAQSASPKASPVRAIAPKPAALKPMSATVGTVQRTFVSAATGNDANPCSRTAPCRNFAAAIAQTAQNGEVIALDSGGYGPVTINQSIALIAPQGVYAGITAFSGNNAIEINAATTDTVILRGLTLNSLNANIGVNVDSVGKLIVDDVTIKNFNNVAMEVVTSADSETYVQDSLIQNNFIGIRFRPLGGTERGWISNTRAEGNSYAFENRDSSIMTIRDSAAVRTAVTGYGTFFAGSEANLERDLASNGQFGIVASSGATRVSETMIVNNDTGINGSATSFGNNRVYANMTNGSFTTTVPQT
jgi:hypothetical protein